LLTDDAYGNALNFTPAAALTSLLYSGEIFDQCTEMQYLRARYYNPASGTFNRLDPFSGRMQDPRSLHKYLYVHGDPVQGIDPTGLVSMSGLGVTMGASGNMRAQNQSTQTTALANTGRTIGHAAQKSLAKAVNALRQSPHLVRQYSHRIAKHILGPHTPPAGTVANAGKSLFKTANPRTIYKLIDKTLKAGRVSGNTGGRSGLIFTRTFSSPVGTNASGQLVYTIKVVVSETGKLITAFPI
jgi:RHS repeat-associated protein